MQQHSGFSMIEVLVTAFVVSVGLLGLGFLANQRADFNQTVIFEAWQPRKPMKWPIACGPIPTV